MFPPQREVLRRGLLTAPRHCVLHMATGSGKTFLSEFAIEDALARGFKAAYVTPLRALAEQQSNRWKERFPDIPVGVFTGETIGASSTRTSYARSRLLVMTPERLDAILRNWRSHWDWLPELDLVVVDEFHLLGMPGRGPRLEGALSRLLRLNPFVRLLALSATVPNEAELADWLGGSFYASAWRRVPLEKRVVRFGKVSDKPALLLEEVHRCLASGGQSLVFCNSRSRVQRVADALRASGIPAAPHHAGLVREARASTEADYKAGRLRCLVATSTLEMGLNLPARQVVIYDSFSFDGEGFSDLPVWSFIQRAGRAGRPGLDDSGEVVLFLSRWASGAERYLEGDCESVRSRLSEPRALAEQLLVDVHTGLSRTRGELRNGFLPRTLFRRQHPGASLEPVLNKLLRTGLLEEAPAPERGNEEPRLRVGVLGRLAVKLMLAPETIELVRDAVTAYDGLKFFDVVLLVTLSPDCSPVLQADFEELDALAERLDSRPSVLLDEPLERLRRRLPGLPPTVRFLAGIKMATLILALTDGENPAVLAETFDVYEADIRMLAESVVRLLQGTAAVASALVHPKNDATDPAATEEDGDDSAPVRTLPGAVPDLCSQLQSMIRYGIPAEMVPLTRLTGVGGKIARSLVDAGYESLDDVSRANPATLVAAGVCGEKLARRMVEEAYGLLVAFDDTLNYEEKVRVEPAHRAASAPQSKSAATSTIDPYRLRRSLELRVLSGDAPLYRVVGGTEPHKVLARAGAFACDCEDFRKGTVNCKHVLAVRRARGDTEIRAMAERIARSRSASVRDSLPTLWYGLRFEEDVR